MTLYSIGYSTRTTEKFIQLLKDYSIEYVIDVRTQPYSKRFPNYKKQTIEKNLSNHGIRYVFMGDSLGWVNRKPMSGFIG